MSGDCFTAPWLSCKITTHIVQRYNITSEIRQRFTPHHPAYTLRNKPQSGLGFLYSSDKNTIGAETLWNPKALTHNHRKSSLRAHPESFICLISKANDYRALLWTYAKSSTSSASLFLTKLSMQNYFGGGGVPEIFGIVFSLHGPTLRQAHLSHICGPAFIIFQNTWRTCYQQQIYQKIATLRVTGARKLAQSVKIVTEPDTQTASVRLWQNRVWTAVRMAHSPESFRDSVRTRRGNSAWNLFTVGRNLKDQWGTLQLFPPGASRKALWITRVPLKTPLFKGILSEADGTSNPSQNKGIIISKSVVRQLIYDNWHNFAHVLTAALL